MTRANHQPPGQTANSVDALLADKQYRLVGKLGHGAMGEVHAVIHSVLKRRFALKVIHPQYANEARFVDRMRIEAQATARLHHPNIVEVVDFWVSSDGRPCIVMELLEGATVAHELMVHGPFPVAEAVEYTCQLLSALSAALALGIVHRDIKPENLFLHNAQGRPTILKVLDFGVARVLPQASERAPHPPIQPTDTGVIVGTPRFASPEGLRGEKVDHRADVFSAGLVLYTMLTRHGAFDRMLPRDNPELYPVEPPSCRVNSGITPALDRIVLNAIRWKIEERYQNATDLLHDLRKLPR